MSVVEIGKTRGVILPTPSDRKGMAVLVHFDKCVPDVDTILKWGKEWFSEYGYEVTVGTFHAPDVIPGVEDFPEFTIIAPAPRNLKELVGAFDEACGWDSWCI